MPSFCAIDASTSRRWFSGNEDNFLPLEQMELTSKYEQILERRGALLEQMEQRRLQLKDHRSLRREKSEAARSRNRTLLQDLENLEQRLREAQLPSTELQKLEQTYWASVEESLPAWEQVLLGEGPHGTDVQSDAVGPKAKSRRSKGLPPRPAPVRHTNSPKRK
ncbi:hypothetical protein WMY93_004380 [Mugilogobius chulae]|uniref:Uncharacterized protein n=1 Tax=Mugilogobius chulae TaxID=88201 RepID=A0AAW0PWT9_9GOBI